MSKRRILSIAALLLCSAVPLFAGGGGDDGDWELGAYWGVVQADTYNGLDPSGGSLYGARVGYFLTRHWSLEGSYQKLSTTGDVGGGEPDVDLNALRMNILFNFRPQSKFRWFLTAGIGSETTKATDVSIDQTDFGYNVGGGGRWYFGREKHWGLRADARWIEISAGENIDQTQSNYEGTGGIFWSFGGGVPPDTDGDGVADSKDKCAGTPKGARVDEKGCPRDSDTDGVFDGLDKCANTPKGWKVDSSGCPADNDGDGVADAVDTCPNTTKGAKVDEHGCPTEDADGDGVYDGADRCPATPKGAKVDGVGCPMDADRDGVWDGIDRCANTPAGMKVDAAGCPMAAAPEPMSAPAPTPAPAPVQAPAPPPAPVQAPAPPPPAPAPVMIPEAKKPVVLKGVSFASGSATLTPDSYAVLRQVAESLKDNPDVRVEIGGHTDSTGAAATNDTLSQARAEAVRDYLMGHGLDAAQLTARGYGSTRPIADNATAGGRARNRRVELSRIGS